MKFRGISEKASSCHGKRVAQIKLTLNKRSVEALKPADKPFIAWDDTRGPIGAA